VIVTQEHDPTVGHGGQKSKGYHFLHRHEQSNGIMAPSFGRSKTALHKSLSYHYGVPKGMEAPKLTAAEKKYEHIRPHYKMNEAIVTEKDHRICFCGHEAGSHNANGCKTCRREGHVTPGMAAHQFKLNSTMKMDLGK
jgi:hypothetical protein